MSSSVTSQTLTSTSATTPSSVPSGGVGGGGNGNGNGNGNGGGTGNGGGGGNGNFNLAGSASLYLYTFLATLVLLLSVSAAIVVRSFILRRRHRLMVEEAIRNGTWVPPTPPTRAPRVDLSKKPALWEAYLGVDGNLHVEGERGLGQGSGKDSRINNSWTLENSKDWECIKPVYADYIASAASVPYSGPTTNLNLSPPVPIPVPAPVTTLTPSGTRDEENQRTTQASTRPSFFTRARMFLSPTPAATSPLPASPADNAANANRTDPSNMSMTELTSSSPTTMRVAVLIAMPSPPPSHRSSLALSSSFSSSSSSPTSNSNVPEPTTSHPLQLSPLQAADDDEHPLPVLEMGVAEIPVGSSENSTSWDSARRGRAKATYSRGSSYAEP